MNKKILIVGAGFGQVPAILKAKELGLKVIVVDKNESAIGMPMADFAYNIDTVDKRKILEIAIKHQIDGIITMQSDLPVPSIGYVNDELGLKGVSYRTANYCSNKIETRKRLAEKNCQQPHFRIICTIDEAMTAVSEIGFPCVIKAPDSSGSRGVVKINKIEDIPEAFEEAIFYTRGKELLIEEYISGLEFGAQTFSINGKCEVVLLHNDTMSPPPYMIPTGHSFPFKHSIDLDKAVSDIKNAIETIGITDGPANIDLILDTNSNTIKIIEIGARIGATCLPELVHYHTGIDWVETTIMNAIGEKVSLIPTKNQPVAALILESPKDGIYKGYSIEDAIKGKILEYEITAQIGESVNILRKGTDRIGKILAYGNTVEEAEQKAKKLRDSIIIFVE